jgi:hypothetical protein
MCPDNSSLTRITDILHEELCTFVTMCCSVLLRLRNISDKIWKKKMKHILYFSENHAVYEILWKNIVQPDWPQITFWCVRFVCWLTKTHTHTHCHLSMAKMVTWTRLVVLFIRTLPVVFNVKLRTRREEQPHYIFYYPFQIFVLFFNLLLSLIQWRRSWVFSGNLLLCTELKTIKFGKMEALAFTAVEGSDLWRSLYFVPTTSRFPNC